MKATEIRQSKSLQMDYLCLFEKLQYVRSLWQIYLFFEAITIYSKQITNESFFTDTNIAMTNLKNDPVSRLSELDKESIHPFAVFNRRTMVGIATK